MGSVDRAWLRMDDPANLMIVNALIVLAEPLSRAQLSALIGERLGWIPRRRLCVARGWVWDRWREHEVRIDEHVHEHPRPESDADLRAQVSELVSKPLDPQRPLWELHLIPGPSGGSVILARVHHSLGDGLALLLVLLSLTDVEPEPRRDNPLRALFGGRGDHREAASPGWHGCTDRSEARVGAGGDAQDTVERARRFLREVMPTGMKLMLHQDHRALEDERDHPASELRRGARLLGAAARDLGALLVRRPDSATVFRGQLDVQKRVAWSRPIPLARLRQRRLGTVNDILLAAITGSLRRYILARGDAPDGVEMRAAVPVNLRGLAELARLGNRCGLVFLTLPIGIADPRARLTEIHRRMDELKHSVEPLVTWGILELMGSSPKLVERLILDYFAKRVSFVMTNVPGPERRLYLAGREITDLMFWVPQSGRVGLGVSMFSYAGAVRLGIACDARLVPDPEALIASFDEELDSMLGSPT